MTFVLQYCIVQRKDIFVAAMQFMFAIRKCSFLSTLQYYLYFTWKNACRQKGSLKKKYVLMYLYSIILYDQKKKIRQQHCSLLLHSRYV